MTEDVTDVCIECGNEVTLEGENIDGHKCLNCGGAVHDNCGIDEYCFDCG